MAIFDGWYVYKIGTGANGDGNIGNAERSNGNNLGSQTITNGDNTLVNADTFSISQLPNGGPFGGDTNASMTFFGSNSDDTQFIAQIGSVYYLFSRTPLAANVSNVATTLGISTANGIEALLCFLAGTRMLTENGEVEVEKLAVGDRLITSEGCSATIRWLGKRTVHTLFTPAERGNPIRITAGALSDNVPCRDLFVSPDHAMLVDGLLVDAKALINGATIFQVERMPETFTYWHVETEGHQVLLAEGAPAETFVDYVGRRRFDNWAEYEAMYPDAKPIAELAYPRVSAARVLPNAVRERLAARAATLAGEAAKAA